MQRRQLIGALVAIVAVLGGTIAGVIILGRHGSSAAPATSTSSSHEGVTSEDQLVTLIRTQGLTPQRAEELFALDIGPLPGVSVVGIKPDNGFDGTVAAEALYGEWNNLSQSVRNAATKLLSPSAIEAVPPLAPATLPPTPTLTAGAASVATQHDALPHLMAARTGTAQLMNSAKAFYTSLASEAIAAEAAATQTPPVQADIQLLDTFPTNPGLYAEAVLHGDYSTQPRGCEIDVYDPRFAGLDLNTSAGIIAHEVFHCFQERLAETVANFLSVSKWLVEGEATWVMEQLHPGSSSPVAAWTKYEETPLTTYVDRSYDALGIYGHLGDILGDQAMVWPLLLPVFHTGFGGHDVAALTQLISGHSQHYFDSWGPSYYEDSFQADWHMAGPGMPPTSGPFASTSSTVNAGATVDIASQPQYVAQDVSLVGDADIVVVVMASGYGEIHDNGYKVDQTLSDTAPVALCLKSGGCKCPNGSPGASEFTLQATIPISLGFDGGDKGLGAYAHGDSLDKYCKHPDPPGPPTSGSSVGGSGGGTGEPELPPQTAGRSAGDPHLFTFDGHIYDMQAAGEFTLVKSTMDDFDVQARTVPLPGGRPVAVNQAVATTLGGHRVSLTLENGNIVLRVDGTMSDFVQQDIGGGTIDRNGTEAGTGYVLEWPDGTKLVVDPMGIHGLDVAVTLADDRKGKVVGLLGDGNAATSASFVTSSGVNLGSALSPQAIDGQYAELRGVSPRPNRCSTTSRVSRRRHLPRRPSPRASSTRTPSPVPQPHARSARRMASPTRTCWQTAWWTHPRYPITPCCPTTPRRRWSRRCRTTWRTTCPRSQRPRDRVAAAPVPPPRPQHQRRTCRGCSSTAERWPFRQRPRRSASPGKRARSSGSAIPAASIEGSRLASSIPTATR